MFLYSSPFIKNSVNNAFYFKNRRDVAFQGPLARAEKGCLKILCQLLPLVWYFDVLYKLCKKEPKNAKSKENLMPNV